MPRARSPRTATPWWRRLVGPAGGAGAAGGAGPAGDVGPARAVPPEPGRRPLVSVVVPVYDVEPYLAEAVASLTAQTYPHLEILLVDDASRDGSLALARRLAADDERIDVVEAGHGGLGATRNRGTERARGEYLTFVDADDVLPPDAIAAMVASLEASGSAFVVGGVERYDSTRAWVPAWVRAAHARDRRGTTLAELPEAMRDILACNRMFRRDFWDERIGPFPEGMVYEDHVPMLRAYLGGTRFDVLAQVTYRWRRREDGTSLSQPKDELANLADRARAKADAWALLEREGTATERALWLARVLDLDLVPYLNHAGTAAPEYQDLLATTVATYLDAASATPEGRRELAARVRGPQRLAAWYAAHRDWTALASLVTDLERRRPPLARLGRATPGAARAVVSDPERATLAPPLPGWWAEAPLDLRPSLVLTRLTWDDEGLVVRGTLKVPGLALAADDVVLTIDVGGEGAAAPPPATVRTTILGAPPRRADAPVTGTDLEVRAHVPRADLGRARQGTADLPVVARLDLAGTAVPVTLVAGTGTRAPRPRADLVDDLTVLPVLEDGALVLRRGRARVVVTAVDVVDDALRVDARLSPAPAGGTPAGLGFGPAESRAALDPSGGTRTVALAALAGVPHDAPLDADLDGRTVRAVAAARTRRGLPRGLAASARGTLHAIPGPRALLVALVAEDDGIRLDLVEAGLADVPAGSAWQATLRDGDVVVPLAVTGDAPARAWLDVPRGVGADGAGASVASVRLELVGPDGALVPLRVADGVLDAQPSRAPSGAYDVRALARRDGVELRVEHLEAPATAVLSPAVVSPAVLSPAARPRGRRHA